MEKTKYGISAYLLPAIASVGIAFSGLEARAENPFWGLSRINERQGDHAIADLNRFNARLLDEQDREERIKKHKEREDEIDRDYRRLEDKIDELNAKLNSNNNNNNNSRDKNNNSNNQPPEINKKTIKMFVCNYPIYASKGVIKDYANIKDNFRKKESIMPVAVLTGFKGSTYNYRIYDPKGYEVSRSTKEETIDVEEQITYMGIDQEQFKKNLFQSGVAGTFKVVLEINGQKAAEKEFVVEE